uniref:DUF2855 family protein n=1 Tax=Mucochytrium quahogii TaxID=96639 RepID=A0A7S2RYR8_9STRA|mmetsp:Transcript_11409/g.18586  ORF Transcript_11409/g.18586 Transcript_11409/m.18586 type:complete len:365 (+) Transcript_11409:197-1291(+)
MPQLVVDCENVAVCSIEEEGAMRLAPGQVLVKVVKVAFTSNVISYALGGKSLRYFDFFPGPSARKGVVPSWGIGVVVATRDSRIQENERIYGLFPFSQLLVLNVSVVRPGEFVDLAENRKDLSTVYNTYMRLGHNRDPFYVPGAEDYMILLRPLFVTAWLLKEFTQRALADFDEKQVIISCASSKTAMSLAFLLKHCSTHAISVVGLTSTRNARFVNALEVYDKVVVYDDIESEIPVIVGTQIVDMSGNGNMLRRIILRIPSAKCALVGATDWEKGMKDLPGKFFFAPAQAVQVIKQIGKDAFDTTVSTDWVSFLGHAKKYKWVHIEYRNGPDAVLDVYRQALHQNLGDASVGLVLSMWDNAAL